MSEDKSEHQKRFEETVRRMATMPKEAVKVTQESKERKPEDRQDKPRE